MEDQQMSDAPQLTQDGGKSGDMRVALLLMIKVKFSKLKTKNLTQMLKTETFKSTLRETISDNNGRSFMLTIILSQRRENSMSDSDSLLKETSTLCQPCQVEDTLISSTTGTWSSRLQMEERLKSGTSINNLRLSELD
jgi:hypothetical protein